MNRKLLAAVVSGALVLPMAVQGVEVSVSGHLNRALLIGDDEVTGKDTDVKHVDGGASPSRFRMTGSADLGNGVTAGVNLEYGVGKTKSQSIKADLNDDGKDDGPDDLEVKDGSSIDLRHSAVYFSGAFGKLTLGHTSQATDSIAYSNFDNHAWAAGIEIGCDFCSGLPTYGGTRSQIARYDTPGIGPATISVSGDGNDFWDAAIRLASDVGGGGYQLKVGYGDTEDKQANMAVSGAFGLSNGTHFNLAWGRQDPDGKDDAGKDKPDASYWHFGAGHNFGNSSIAVTYTDHDDKGGTQSWGIGVGHGMPKAGVEVYAGYKHLDYDNNKTAKMDDHGFFVVGSRVQFN